MKENTLNFSVKTFLATLLVGGTALGAGMLALPLATAGAGLLPTWCVYIMIWLYSVSTGLLFVEIATWMPDGSNIVSMATRYLGKWGRGIAWILYIFLFYLLTIAYISGGGKFTAEFFGAHCPLWVGNIVFTLFFGAFVYMGTKISGRLNFFLMLGLVVSYLSFIVIGSVGVEPHHWLTAGWGRALLGLPIIFTSFSYQGFVPSLMTYLDRDVPRVRLAIIVGTAIPLVAYLLWDFIIKGLVPVEGVHGLIAAREEGVTAIDPLFYHLRNSSIFFIGKSFAFFALTTSFVGVTLGLKDFLIDSMGVERNRLSLLGICALMYIPALFITLMNPSIFLRALGLAGGFGCALLLGMLPILMVYVGRYRMQSFPQERILPGGKIILGILFCFVLFEVCMEIINELVLL